MWLHAVIKLNTLHNIMKAHIMAFRIGATKTVNHTPVCRVEG